METSHYLQRVVSFFKLFIPMYLGLTIIISLVSYLIGQGSIFTVGNALIFSGVGLAILGFLALTNIGNTRSGDGNSLYLRDNNFFKRERTSNRSFEKVVVTGIIASLCVTASGYLLLYLFG
ncbi:MAG: hypothetical protein GY797_12925 [Deltaproteobacteria bacterium]|nr:hypothetical protein [Deltaproteobacteria bacterium]